MKIRHIHLGQNSCRERSKYAVSSVERRALEVADKAKTVVEYPTLRQLSIVLFLTSIWILQKKLLFVNKNHIKSAVNIVLLRRHFPGILTENRKKPRNKPSNAPSDKPSDPCVNAGLFILSGDSEPAALLCGRNHIGDHRCFPAKISIF